MKIVIPGDDPPQIQGSPHLARLAPFGEVVLYTDRPATDADKLRRAADAVVLLNSRGIVKWPGHLLRQLPRLKMVAVCGIGTDAIDLDAARALGLVVCNIGDRTAPIVAEHALALMFAAARRAWFHTNELKQGRWSAVYNVYLRGKTLGLVDDPAGGGEHQGQGVLGDDGGGAAGDVADDDALLTGRPQVDGVGADAADGDHPQPVGAPQERSGPLDGAA